MKPLSFHVSAGVLLALLFIGLSGASLPVKAENCYIAAGPVFEYNLYGQPGISAEVACKKVLGGHPQIKLQFTSSKLSIWNGPYDLSVNDFYCTASWYFRPEALVNPYAGIDVGYTWYKRSETLFKLLDNRAMRLNVRGGARFAVWGGRILPYIDGGYVIVQTSTTYPLFFSCGVGYDIMKGIQK